MGGSHSEIRSYRVTPDHLNDLSMEYITITKDVLRRLERLEWERKSPQVPYQQPRPLPTPRSVYRRPIRDREDALNEAIRRNEETFRRTVNNLEQKLQKKAEEDSQNPLKSASDTLVECLKRNPGEALRCSQEVQDFNRQIFNLALREHESVKASTGSG